jgi:hypothetical protein
MADDDEWQQRIEQAEEADLLNPISRWIIAARNMMAAYGVFPSEAAAWKFARERHLPLNLIDTIPLGYATDRQVDVAAVKRQLER